MLGCLIRVHITGHLKEYTGKEREFEVEDVHDVSELIEKLNKRFPGIKDRIFDDQDRTRPYVNIFVNGENIRDSDAEKTKLKDNSQVHILPSVAGGHA